jgi:hypothetical protein
MQQLGGCVFCAWSVPRGYERIREWERKFRVSVESELSTLRDIQAGVPQGSVLSPTLYCLYVNDTPQTPGVHLGLFGDDTFIYATDHKGGYVLRKLQRGLSAVETWCERWTQAI